MSGGEDLRWVVSRASGYWWFVICGADYRRFMKDMAH